MNTTELASTFEIRTRHDTKAIIAKKKLLMTHKDSVTWTKHDKQKAVGTQESRMGSLPVEGEAK